MKRFKLAHNKSGRVILSDQASTSKGVAKRYATALFDLANETDDVSTLEKNVEILKQAIDESTDSNNLISSPIYSRDQQKNAIGAIATKMGMSGVMINTLSLMTVLFFLYPSLRIKCLVI